MEPTKWLKPLLPDGGREKVKYLILWTFPGQVTLKVNETRRDSDKPIYYCDLRNRFRKVMEGVFWEENSEIFNDLNNAINDLNNAINDLNNAINDLNKAISSECCKWVYGLQKQICTEYGIALRDRVAECYLLRSSKDTERLPKKYHNFYKYVKDRQHIVVLLNWRGAWSDFRLCESEYEEQRELFFSKWNESNGIIGLNTEGLNTEGLNIEKLQSWMNFLDVYPNLCSISIKRLPSTSWMSSDKRLPSTSWMSSDIDIVKDWKKILKCYK